MGWKSTKEISREKALELIHGILHKLSNEELGIILGDIYGDNEKRKYYGHNFWVNDEETEEDEI